VLSLRLRLSISGLSPGGCGDRCCFSKALWNDRAEVAEPVSVEYGVPSCVGVCGSVVSKTNRMLLLEAKRQSVGCVDVTGVQCSAASQ
jgi:hypothetical protein